MDYRIISDIDSVMEILGLTQGEYARELGISRMTLNNWLSGRSSVSLSQTKQFYEYAYSKGILLNKIKQQLYIEDNNGKNDVLLYHGAKTEIRGKLSLGYSREANDFGKGFYCGESPEQSAMFVAAYPSSSLYILSFNGEGLKKREYSVDRDWMLTVAYFRGRINDHKDSKVIKKLINGIHDLDYIVAPIADNRMFEIIDSFIDGEITDIQCQHCLSAIDLGKQYVFVSEKALDKVTLLERCYLADKEKEYYLRSRQTSFKMNQDKVKLARKQYRNQGNYIEDILI